MTTWTHTSTYTAPCIDADGNEYSTVKIGRQEWMSENLKTTKYNDGSPIVRETGTQAWKDLYTNHIGGRCEYNNDTANSDIYGYLYNRLAVETDAYGRTHSAELTPNGWRIPTLNDYKELERYLGMSITDSELTGGGLERGTNEASKLAGRADLWSDDDLDSNSNFGTSGFNALPGGYRYWLNGLFYSIGTDAYFWTTTGYGSIENHRRQLQHDHTDLHAGSGGRANGHSVRCIRDDVSSDGIYVSTDWSSKYLELKWNTWGNETTDFWQEWE